MTSSSVSKAKLTNSDLEVDLIVVPVCKFWFPVGKYWLAIFSTASLAIWLLWARLAMLQGNLFRGIDNCSDAVQSVVQSIRRPWATVSVASILYFNRFINTLYNHEYLISSYKAAGTIQVAAGSNQIFTGSIDGVDNNLVKHFDCCFLRQNLLM